jgi:phosphatidylserine/phosphatidylglycerophosphate/cardiolipin synthase-like enzyme
MSKITLRVIAVALLAMTVVPSIARASDEQRIELHYAPEERLDAIDAALIGSARSSIDMAAYVLTDYAVIDALKAAQKRGVAIRIVVDPREPNDADRLGPLIANVKMKRGGALMHLKAYEVDGQVLRTGSANFSLSGERDQNNDLVVIHNAGDAHQFTTAFNTIWDAAE